MRPFIAGLIAASTLALSGCGYNTIQTQDEAVKAAWSDVVNQYQRRADLIPNLVATVKGYAAHEQSVLVGDLDELVSRILDVAVPDGDAEPVPHSGVAYGCGPGRFAALLRPPLQQGGLEGADPFRRRVLIGERLSEVAGERGKARAGRDVAVVERERVRRG